MSSPPLDARGRAAEVLVRVARDGAFAAPVLDAALDRPTPLAPRDRGLCTELVYGVLRAQPALDAALGRHTRDGVGSLAKLDPLTLATLRVAAYQVLALARVPARAAVDAAVGAIRRTRSPGLAGFANAVLRKLAAERPDPLPEDARTELFVRAVPPVVRARLAGLLGEDGAEAVIRASVAKVPAVMLRTNTRRLGRDELLARLREALPAAEVTAARRAPAAVQVVGGGDPTALPLWQEGLCGVQEEGAQLVCLEAEVRPGMRVLDACAGVGGKSAYFAMQLAGEGTLHAVDAIPEKLARLRATLAREGTDTGISLGTFAADLAKGLGDLPVPAGGYDLAMVDVPCSGLGTLAHRPDILLRLRDETAWAALTALQSAILARVAETVRPGGALVYAVCTLTREESDDVIARFLASRTGWQLARRTVLRADLDGTEGFVAHRLVRAP